MKNTVRRDSSFIAHGAFESFESIKDLDRFRNEVALTLRTCRAEEKACVRKSGKDALFMARIDGEEMVSSLEEHFSIDINSLIALVKFSSRKSIHGWMTRPTDEQEKLLNLFGARELLHRY